MIYKKIELNARATEHLIRWINYIIYEFQYLAYIHMGHRDQDGEKVDEM